MQTREVVGGVKQEGQLVQHLVFRFTMGTGNLFGKQSLLIRVWVKLSSTAVRAVGLEREDLHWRSDSGARRPSLAGQGKREKG